MRDLTSEILKEIEDVRKNGTDVVWNMVRNELYIRKPNGDSFTKPFLNLQDTLEYLRYIKNLPDFKH